MTPSDLAQLCVGLLIFMVGGFITGASLTQLGK